jgi:ferrous iron transport protein B
MFHAVKLAELDEVEVLMHKDTVNMVEAFKKTHKDEIFGDDFEALVADARYKYITKYFSPTLKRKNKEKFVVTPSDKADKVLTHKIWGIPIFLVILFTIFHLTFSENLFFIGGLLPENWVSLEGTAFEGVFGSGGINSPGVMLMGVMEVFTNWITGLVAGLFSTSPEWVSGIICDGVLGGIFAIMSFLPQILILFLFFSILEDSGYMARIAFILDRALRKFGLSGRAFLPMIMGFGCSVPAMINTRTLADEKEKLATIRVIPFFSCGAKLPILTAVAGGIVMHFGVGNVDLITYGMYLVGIITALLAVILMRETTLKGDTPPFIMELPAYHAPQFKNLMVLLWDKAKHFIKKAFTIILASTIVIWVVSHFDFAWNYLSDEDMEKSILGGIGQLIQPLFTPMGFGSQLNSMGWVFAVAAITGLIAKENVVSTLGTLAACVAGVMLDVEADGGINAVNLMIQSTGITLPALLSFIAFNMTTIPCFAAVAAARGETVKKSTFNWTLLFWLATSYIVGTTIYLVGSFVWTLPIFLAIAGIVIFLVRAHNKKRKIKE